MPSFSTASSETVLLIVVWVKNEHRSYRRSGRVAKDDRTVFRLDGLQYALKYAIKVQGWHFSEKLLIAGVCDTTDKEGHRFEI